MQHSMFKAVMDALQDYEQNTRYVSSSSEYETVTANAAERIIALIMDWEKPVMKEVDGIVEIWAAGQLIGYAEPAST